MYRVRGADGFGQEAGSVWRIWLSRNPSHLPVRDVTGEVKQAIAAANGFGTYAEMRRALLLPPDDVDKLSHLR